MEWLDFNHVRGGTAYGRIIDVIRLIGGEDERKRLDLESKFVQRFIFKEEITYKHCKRKKPFFLGHSEFEF